MIHRRSVIGAALALWGGHAAAAIPEAPVTLFKVVTARDEIVIGLTREDVARLGGADAALVARAIAGEGAFSAWQYAVRRAPDGSLRQAPLRRVALLAASSLRVEPYATPLAVVAP